MAAQSTTEIPDGFQPVCPVDDVPQGLAKKVNVDGRGVLICREDHRWYAVDEICPHRNQSMERASVAHGEITCPHHRFRFDLETGRCNRSCAPVQIYDVIIEDGRVWVRV